MYTVSEEGRNRIISDEGGLVLTAYNDCKGVPTIGAGHTGKVNGQAIRKGMTITREKAKQLFNDDIKKFERLVNDAVKVPITQRWFDALVNFTYINGHIKGTRLIAAVNRQDWATATRELSIEKIHEPRMKRWRSYVSGGSEPASNVYANNSSVDPAETQLALERNSRLREDLAMFMDCVNSDDEDEPPKTIALSMKEVDVTGSRSVWEIS